MKQAETNLLNFQSVDVDLCEHVIFNYQVVNKASPDPKVVGPALASAGSNLAAEAREPADGEFS